MKAIQVRELGEADVLELADVSEPVLKDDEVLVEVKAAAVNYADVLIRRGSYGTKRSLPFVPGFEAAGVVLQTGKCVSGWSTGQRVMGTVLRDACGCYAQRAAMPAWLLMPVPDAMTFEQAAAFSEVFITAYLALHVFGRLAAGEDVLIHAAGGGVGTAAVQLAHAMGARVFATASSQEKLDRIRSLGADVLINYATHDFLAEVKSLTQGRGVDVLLESVGGEVFDKSLKALKPAGRMVVFGSSSGNAQNLSGRDLLSRSITVAGFSFGWLSVVRQDLIRLCMQAVSEFLASGKIHPVVGHVFPLAEARAAHELISSRASFGKILLIP